MRGPDRKGVRGLSNMTDSHMVGGHRSSFGGGRLYQQVLSFAAILAGAAGLFLVAASLWSEDPGLRLVAWVVLGVLVAAVAGLQIRHRLKRGSLDDALRSRRTPE